MRDVGEMTYSHCGLRRRQGCRAWRQQAAHRPKRNGDQNSAHAVTHILTPVRQFDFSFPEFSGIQARRQQG
jgi:hypothetical protein